MIACPHSTQEMQFSVFIGHILMVRTGICINYKWFGLVTTDHHNRTYLRFKNKIDYNMGISKN